MFARALSLLAACMLALAQPLAGFCACVGCSVKHDAEQRAAAPARSCCAAKATASGGCTSSSGSSGCTCGHEGRPDSNAEAPHAGDGGLPSCSCSAAPNPAAATTTVSAVDHLASAHVLATVAASPFEPIPQFQPGLSTLAELPPPAGGLRIHALYRVWRI